MWQATARYRRAHPKVHTVDLSPRTGKSCTVDTQEETYVTVLTCTQQRYKTWEEVQAYFQLLNFEEEIPGVECRPENAKLIDTADQDVTLEEEVARREEKKAMGMVVEEVEDSRKRTRGKKDEDEDYTPGKSEMKKVGNDSSASNKRTRRSLPSNTGSKKEAPSSAKGGNTTLEESTKATISSNASTTSSVNMTKSSRGLNSSVTISEVKKTSDVVEVISSETLNPATQKLFNERFEAFKHYCAGVDGKPDPVFAGEKTIVMFLNSLAQKKNMNKSVQEGYRQVTLSTVPLMIFVLHRIFHTHIDLQAILKVQAMKKEERKMAEPRSAAQSSAPTRGPAPRQPAPAATTATTQRPSAPRATVPRQSASNIRQTTAPAAPRQAGPTIQQVTPRPQQAAPRSRQVTPNPRQSNPAPRQPAPRQAAPRGAATATPTIRQQTSSLVQGAQHTQLPSFLTRQVKCTLKESKAAGSNLSDQLFRYPFLAALSSTLEVAKACIEPQLSTLGSDKGPSKSCAG